MQNYLLVADSAAVAVAVADAEFDCASLRLGLQRKAHCWAKAPQCAARSSHAPVERAGCSSDGAAAATVTVTAAVDTDIVVVGTG